MSQFGKLYLVENVSWCCSYDPILFNEFMKFWDEEPGGECEHSTWIVSESYLKTIWWPGDNVVAFCFVFKSTQKQCKFLYIPAPSFTYVKLKIRVWREYQMNTLSYTTKLCVPIFSHYLYNHSVIGKRLQYGLIDVPIKNMISRFAIPGGQITG